MERYWYLYDLAPIDHNWEYLPTVEAIAKELGATEAVMTARHGSTSGCAGIDLASFLEAWDSAQGAIPVPRERFSHPPVVMWLPFADEDRFGFGFIAKDSNNGTTYVVSPVPMPHLGTPQY